MVVVSRKAKYCQYVWVKKKTVWRMERKVVASQLILAGPCALRV